MSANEFKEYWDKQKNDENEVVCELSDFLTNYPPGTIKQINSKNLLINRRVSGNGSIFDVSVPYIGVYCNHEHCQKTMIFRSSSNISIYVRRVEGYLNTVYCEYRCSNCKQSEKLFALLIMANMDQVLIIKKIGENPAYGPHTPAYLTKMLGEDRENFLKGRRCETQNLGIAAFAYYRRIVEDQKDRIFDKIINVVEKTSPDNELVQELKSAKTETQFTKSVEMIKRTLPQSLLINGENPLLLLHSALSEGLHNHTDEECLIIAQDVRTVLSELAAKLKSALNERNEVTDAVKRLQSKRNPPKLSSAG